MSHGGESIRRHCSCGARNPATKHPRQPDVAGARGIIVSVLPENVVALSWQAVRLLCLLISMRNGCRVLSRFRLGTAASSVEIMPVGMGVEAALIDSPGGPASFPQLARWSASKNSLARPSQGGHGRLRCGQRLAYHFGDLRTRFTSDRDIRKARAMSATFTPALNDARMRFAVPSGIFSIPLILLLRMVAV